MMKIVILGGYGNFGKRIAEQLAQDYKSNTLEIVIAGRNVEKAKAFAAQLSQRYSKYR